jgi:pyruvyl transferase EpsO
MRVLGDTRVAFDHFVLIDFPNHSNIGDSAIWAGEMAYFDSIGCAPAYVCDHLDVDWPTLDRHVASGATIVIHGGGNFGDLWPDQHGFREEVLARYPRQRVIQMPQSVHFRDAASWRRTAEIVRRHGDFVFLVRDWKSLALAEKMGCEVRLCPDMAFCLGAVDSGAEPRSDLVVLLRTDHEGVGIQPEEVSIARSVGRVVDWVDEPAVFRAHNRLSRLLHLLAPTRGAKVEHYRTLAGRRVDRGLRLLASGRAVVTDRLHGHILSLLLGQPSYVLDNSYGKLRTFIDTWGTVGASSRVCGSVREAVGAASAQVAAGGQAEAA